MRSKLTRLDGKLYVFSEDSLTFEPILRFEWLPVSDVGTDPGRPQHEPSEGDSLSWSSGHRVWRASRDGIATGWVKTVGVATKVSEIPYLCPKVRTGVKVEYTNGRWRKLMAKG